MKKDRYLSKTEHGWVVIKDGLPLNAGNSFPEAFAILKRENGACEQYWDGFHAKWGNIVEDIFGKGYGIRCEKWGSIYDIPENAFIY